jgi:hypothetical protein
MERNERLSLHRKEDEEEEVSKDGRNERLSLHREEEEEEEVSEDGEGAEAQPP